MSKRSFGPFLRALANVPTAERPGRVAPVSAPPPDLAGLQDLTARVVRDVAAVIIRDAEVYDAPQPADAYEDLFLNAFWAKAPHLLGPRPSRALVATTEERGALCIEYLVRHLIPHCLATERLITHDRPIAWTIRSQQRNEHTLTSYIARLAEDLQSGHLRLYVWHTEDYQARDGFSDRRPEHVGIALGWLRDVCHTRKVRVVDAYLASHITTETTWSTDEIRGARLLFQLQGGTPTTAAPIGRGLDAG